MHTFQTADHTGRRQIITREVFRPETPGHDVAVVVELRRDPGSTVADVYVTTYAVDHATRYGWWHQPDARAMRPMARKVARACGLDLVQNLTREETYIRALNVPHMMSSMTVGVSYRYVAA